MPVPYMPLAVANFFLKEHGSSSNLEHMKLQKLVYCAHGWWLASHDIEDVPLVNERPKVWRHGPVFSSLYKVLKVCGRLPIASPQSISPFDSPPQVDDDDDDATHLLTWVWARYGHLSGFALSELTHRPGTPWHRTAKEHDFSVPRNLEIPDEYIREEFKNIMNRDLGADDAIGRREREATA